MKIPPPVFSRRLFLCLTTAAVFLAAVRCDAQTKAKSGPERFEKDIAAFEAADKTNPPPKNGILYVGASNIRRWSSLAKDFKNQPVFNRGFGGSFLRDVLHFADRIILPYEPKAIVLQAGGNDLNGGRSPEEVSADFKALVAKIHARLPKTTITVLSTPPSEARWAQTDKIRAANKLVASHCEGNPLLSFIDLFNYMLNAEGKPRTELFVEDKLHVNAQGYELWTSLLRWDKEIKTLEASDHKNPPPSGGIVFIGSSSIKRWTNLVSDFPGLPVINHGFGGSQVYDSIVFADQLVTPLKPRLVVFYAGGNDINAGKSPERVLGDFKVFVQKIHAKLPQTRIAFISIAGNPARWAQVEDVKALNQQVEAYTKTDSRLAFINVFPHMLGTDGLPKADIFVADRLHMNPKGYEIWKGVVGPYLTGR
jgi:lysophospholipase L1-like esterase